MLAHHGFWAICVLAAVGCSSPVAPNLENYMGHYFFGVEDTFFVACGSADTWAVDDAGSAISAFINDHRSEFETDPGEPVPTGNVYVRLLGEVSAEGAYGHLGHHEYALTISDVMEVRMSRADDCE